MLSKKLTKAFSVMLCAIICIFGSSAISFAAQQIYTINELDDMQITLPDDMLAVTRSSQSADRYFSLLGITYNDVMKNFEESNIYLQGMDEKSKYVVTVTMSKTDESKGISNYNLLSNSKLAEVTSNFLSQNEYITCTPDTINNNKWLTFDTKVNNNGKAIKVYLANTVYDGMSINVTLQKNTGDVNAEDYAVFAQIISSATFLRESSINSIVPYAIIGVSVLVIVLIIVSIILYKKAKKRRKKNKNDKILEELADKYKSKRTPAKDSSYEIESTLSEYDLDDEEIDISPSKSDEYIYNTKEIDSNDFFKGSTLVDESEDVKVYSPTSDVSENEIDEILNFRKMSEEKEYDDDAPQEVIYQREDLEVEDEPEADSQDDEAEQETPQENEVVKKIETTLFGNVDEEDDEQEDYNDEELVRQEAKKLKFKDSDDFFEEAPTKTMGVISSKEIREAEDFDVINEVEKRVSEVEKPTVSTGETVKNVLIGIGSGIKSFGVHFGYFCTNVSRMIKRKRAISKRKKEEEARRERERMRAERAKRRQSEMQNGGLVRVHRKPTQPQNRRNSNPQRRPNNRRGR